MSNLGQAEVDDVLDVRDGDGGLGHVGRQDYLAVPRQGGLEHVAGMGRWREELSEIIMWNNWIPIGYKVTHQVVHQVLLTSKQGLHLTAKIQDRGYGLGSLRLKLRFETEPELYFILRSPKPRGSVWSSDRFNRGLV